MALTLIDKQDGFEIVRDQIASILTVETANQKALATAASKDPALWDLHIYIERTDPFSVWNNPNKTKAPIVNVWYDVTDYEQAGSNTSSCQTAEGIFNVDIYGYGISKDTAEGHTPGDLAGVNEAQRALKLVRNILMAAENTYLQFNDKPRLVTKRFPSQQQMFQPTKSPEESVHVGNARLKMKVRFLEDAPQVVGGILEKLTTKLKKGPDGLFTYYDGEYDYT